MASIDLTGQKFVRLTVTGPAPAVNWQRQWFVACECGNTLTVSTAKLRSGNTKSCGCLKVDKCRERGKARVGTGKHRLSSRSEYRAWQTMRLRCHVPTNPAFKDYGARGIYVCERWRGSPANFLADMGPKPTPKHEIDRRDNSGSYTCGNHELCNDCREKNAPANCRWVTRTDNSRNRRSNRHLTFRGETHSLVEWSESLGISPGTIASRIDDLGWSVDRALSTRARRWGRRAATAAA